MFQKVGNRKVVSDDGYSIEFVGLNDLIVEGEKGWISTKIRVKTKSLNRAWHTPHSDETISEEKLNSRENKNGSQRHRSI